MAGWLSPVSDMRERDWCQEPEVRIYDIREITVPAEAFRKGASIKEGIFTYRVSLEPGTFGDIYYCLCFKDEEPEGNEVTEIGHHHRDIGGRVGI